MPITNDGVDSTPLSFVPDFQFDDGGEVVWEHVAFSQDSGGAVVMTARVPCARGLFFPLGWVLLTEAAGDLLMGRRSDGGNHIIPIDEPGFGVPGAAFLDTDPFRSQLGGYLCANPHTVLGGHLLRGTPTLPANVEIVHLAEPAYRFGRSRFTGNAAGYYFRPLREITVGEPFVVDWELFVSANMRGAVGSGTPALHNQLGLVSRLLTFRRDVVPPVMSVMEGLPALAPETAGVMSPGSSMDGLGGRRGGSSSPAPAHALSSEERAPPLPTADGSSAVNSGSAVVGAALGGSSVGSVVGEGSLIGGTDRCPSPGYYPTGGDPLTHSAHLVPSPGAREHEAAGGDSKSTDNDPRNIRLSCPLGFVRGPNARNWLEKWDDLWQEIDDHFGGVPTAAQRRDLQRFRKQEQELYNRFLSSSRAPEAPSARKRGVTSARPVTGSNPPPSKRARSFPRANSATPTVVDSSRRGRALSAGAVTIADRLRGAGAQVSVSVLRARYETALEEANVAEAGLIAAAHRSDAAVESAALAYAQAVRSARHGYASAVEVNNRAQGDLLDARDRLTAAWEAEDGDEGLSDGPDDSEGTHTQAKGVLVFSCVTRAAASAHRRWRWLRICARVYKRLLKYPLFDKTGFVFCFYWVYYYKMHARVVYIKCMRRCYDNELLAAVGFWCCPIVPFGWYFSVGTTPGVVFLSSVWLLRLCARAPYARVRTSAWCCAHIPGRHRTSIPPSALFRIRAVLLRLALLRPRF